MTLTPEQRRRLDDALVGAFADPTSLERMVRRQLGPKLCEIADGQNLTNAVFRLVEWAEGHGRLPELIRGACAEVPGNSALQAIAQELLPQGQPAGPVPRPAAGNRPVHLPYHSLGSLFKGRDEVLAQLRESLTQAAGGHATAIVGKALHGLGGVGKTRLAVEYAWRYQKEYSALLFVPADTAQELQRSLAALSSPEILNLPEQEATEEATRVVAVFRWLREHPGWLLILDNVDTPEAAEAVEELLVKLRGGQVLITSRITQWSASVQPLELDVLEEGAAAQFLLERSDRSRRKLSTDAQDAAELARELDGLALALEQAGAYIVARRISLAEYLQAWREHQSGVQEWHDARLMRYPRSLAVTWKTTMDQLGPGEIALLRLLAWLAPEPLPLWVLEGEKMEAIWWEAVGQLNPEASTPSQPREALSRLADFSIVRWEVDDQTILVHRVVQEILRTRLPGGERRQWLTLCLRLLNAALPGDPTDVRTWPRWNQLRPHLTAVIARGDAADIAQPTSQLMNGLGLLLKVKALHSEAEPLYRRALVVNEQSFGPDHPEVAISLNNLASLLYDTNRMSQAEPLLRRALAIDEASFGAEHPTVARDLNNLAQLLKATNRLAEAEPLLRRALAIDEASFGAEHPTVARDLNNLTQLLQATNRLPEAEPLLRRALIIFLEFTHRTGHEHLHLSAVRRNYEDLLQLMGQSEAEIQAEIEMLRNESLERRQLEKRDHPTAE